MDSYHDTTTTPPLPPPNTRIKKSPVENHVGARLMSWRYFFSFPFLCGSQNSGDGGGRNREGTGKGQSN